jgi:putative transposase
LVKAAGRRLEKQNGDVCILREEPVPYGVVYGLENDALRQENGYFWEDSLDKSAGCFGPTP